MVANRPIIPLVGAGGLIIGIKVGIIGEIIAKNHIFLAVIIEMNAILVSMNMVTPHYIILAKFQKDPFGVSS